MLEMFALAYFIKQIKKVASEKGIKPNKWIIITIVSWFAIEILVLVIGFMAFNIDRDGIVILVIPAILLAASSAYIVLEQLKRQPSNSNDSINNLGKEVL